MNLSCSFGVVPGENAYYYYMHIKAEGPYTQLDDKVPMDKFSITQFRDGLDAYVNDPIIGTTASIPFNLGEIYINKETARGILNGIQEVMKIDIDDKEAMEKLENEVE